MELTIEKRARGLDGFYVNELLQYSAHVSVNVLISWAAQQDKALITLKQGPVMSYGGETQNK